MTQRTIRTAYTVAAVALAVALTGCTTDGPQPTPPKVTGVAPTATPSSAAPSSKVTVPGSLDVKRLGAGWATASVAAGTPAGLYAPCGAAVKPKAVAAKTFGYTAPGGYRVVVENAKFTGPAAPRRASMGQALLNCGADERGGAVTTNAVLPAIAKLDSLGAHVTVERGEATTHSAYFTAVTDDLMVSVLVTGPKGGDGEIPSGVLDAFAARVATAAHAAATGGSYGAIAAPKPTDKVYAADAPAGTVDGAVAPEQGTDSAVDPGVSGPVQLPDLEDGPSGMDGPGIRDGWRDPGDEP